MTVPTMERDNDAFSRRGNADSARQHTPVGNISYRGAPFRRSPKTTSFIKIGLVAFLFVCLIILSIVQVTESRKIPRKQRNKTRGENDITVDETGGKNSRRRGKKVKVLKTSEEARVITTTRYLKTDWCKIRPLKQVVRTRNGCEGKFINNFCYGQCNSFYIPKGLMGDDTKQEAFQSCAFCKPNKVEQVSVRLKCPGKRKRGKTMRLRVNKIKECRCIAVPDIDSHIPAPESPISSTLASGETTTREYRR